MNKEHPLESLVALRDAIGIEIPKPEHPDSESVKSVTQQAENLIAESA